MRLCNWQISRFMRKIRIPSLKATIRVKGKFIALRYRIIYKREPYRTGKPTLVSDAQGINDWLSVPSGRLF